MKTTIWTNDEIKVGGTIEGQGIKLSIYGGEYVPYTVTRVEKTGRSRMSTFGKFSPTPRKIRVYEHRVEMSLR